MDIKQQLIDVCHAIGSEIPHWTQGGGGNVSVKVGGQLWIKATGVRLDQISKHWGLACVDCARMRKRPESEESYREALDRAAVSGRASMETGLHVALQPRWVIHFHSLAAIIMAYDHRLDECAVTRWAAGQPLRICFRTVLMPGLELSEAVVGETADAIVLENHGVILQGGNAHELLDHWRAIERHYCYTRQVDLEPSSSDGMLLRNYFPDVAVFGERLRTAIDMACAVRHQSLGTQPVDRDAMEMLSAIGILARERPTLTELPDSMVRLLPGLPAERRRVAP